VGRRSKRAKDKQTNEKSLFGQKRDLRRNLRLFEFFREPENPLMGTPKDTFVLLGKRRTQAKE
jgi:hypothetical protein